MKSISFRIFTKKKKLSLTTELIVIAGIMLPIIFALIAEQLLTGLSKKNINKIAFWTALPFIILMPITWALSFVRKRRLNGQFQGTLELFDEKIVLNERTIMLTEIESLDFDANDFVDSLPVIPDGLNPKRSQGVDNICIVKFIDGTFVKVNFQQKHEGELSKNEDLLIHYFRSGKISFLKLMSVLRISTYKDIQAFKQKHNH